MVENDNKREARAGQPYAVTVSIVLPTYNHARYLSSAVQSILSQTFHDFELIIVNDGSTDDTAELLSRVVDPRVKVLTQGNQGLPSTLNTGFAAALGKYWTWTSADNVVSPAWLEELVKALEEAPAEVGYAVSAFAMINDRDEIIRIAAEQCFETWRLLIRNGHVSFLYKSDLARTAGPYDPSLIGSEDLDMWIRMSRLTRAVHVESVLYYYRVHDDTMTSSMPDRIAAATARTIAKFIAETGGRLDVDIIFPGIRESRDTFLSRWQARIWLGQKLAVSVICPVDVVVDMLTSAVVDRYEEALIGNIVHLRAAKGQWDLAADAVGEFRRQHDSDYLRNLADIIGHQDGQSLKQIPFVTIADHDLTFDRKKQLSRKATFHPAAAEYQELLHKA